MWWSRRGGGRAEQGGVVRDSKKGVNPLPHVESFLGPAHHPPIYRVYALLWRDDHVEDEEVAFQAVGDVVLSRSWVIHRAHILQVLNNLRITKNKTCCVKQSKHLNTLFIYGSDITITNTLPSGAGIEANLFGQNKYKPNA